MERVTERLRPDSPPKLVMSIVPRLREQKDEIIALLREQTELLRRGRPETIARESKSPGQELLEANTPRCDRLLSSGRVDDDIHPSIHKGGVPRDVENREALFRFRGRVLTVARV